MRESRKAEGRRAQKLAAKRETEGILAEGGGVAHFVDSILKHLGHENFS